MESIEASGITGTLRGISYCQSRNIQFGGYVELDHEPDTEEVIEITEKILDKILDCIVIRKLDFTKIIIKSGDDEIRKAIATACVVDPLEKIPFELEGKWTVGVKVSCKDAMYEYPCKFKLDEGVAPDPMEILKLHYIPAETQGV